MQVQGANIEALRKCTVLSCLTDEELEDIAYLTVYGSTMCSALFITKSTRTVYGLGWNKLMRYSFSVHVSIQFRGANRLCMKSEVDVLSDLELKKIVVGGTCGAAITVQGDLYLWGTWIGDGHIWLRKFDDDAENTMMKRALPCRHKTMEESIIGRASLANCGTCQSFQLLGSGAVDVPRYCFLNFDELIVDCIGCQKTCSSIEVKGYNLNYCEPCDLLQEAGPYKVNLIACKVVDVVCGTSFLVVQSIKRHQPSKTQTSLLMYGYLHDEKFKGVELNPGNMPIKMVSCGRAHVAVLTSEGKLYTCGYDRYDDFQLGYRWKRRMGFTTLREVPLFSGSAVMSQIVKICCGSNSTICLLADGSIYWFGEAESGLVKLTEKIKDVSDIALSMGPHPQVFCAKTESSMVYKWGELKDKNPVLVEDVSECWQAMINSQFTYDFSIKERLESQPTFLSTAYNFCPTTWYGNKRLSDLTLKLSDGDFPAHRLILHSQSVYFREILNCDEPISYMNLTSYNATAYKCLLKYFYRVPVEEHLNSEDLFDLLSIAASYKETAVIRDAFRMINLSNVSCLLSKAKAEMKAAGRKAAGMNDLLKACESYVRSPPVLKKLFQHITDNPEKALEFLGKHGVD